MGVSDPGFAHRAELKRLLQTLNQLVPSIHRKAYPTILQRVLYFDVRTAKKQVLNLNDLLQISGRLHRGQHPLNITAD